MGDAGYRVCLNRPYGNALAPVGYVGHSVMIELNKRCYMDERTLRKTAGAARMETILRGLYTRLLRRPTATSAPFHPIKQLLTLSLDFM